MRRSTKQYNSLHQQIKLRVVDLLVVLPEEVETLDGAQCNTPCYGPPNYFLITFIRGLIIHQVPAQYRAHFSFFNIF
jgi:hypothetical protein